MAPTKHPIGGPMHQLMSRLITKHNVEALGFLDWSTMHDLVNKGFEEQEMGMLRTMFSVAQYVVLSQRFGIKTAGP